MQKSRLFPSAFHACIYGSKMLPPRSLSLGCLLAIKLLKNNKIIFIAQRHDYNKRNKKQIKAPFLLLCLLQAPGQVSLPSAVV